MNSLGAILRGSLTACACGAALAASPASARAAPVPQGFVGVMADQPVWPNPLVDLGQQLDAMVASGVQTLRVVFDWSAAQPYKSWSQVPSSERSQFTDVHGIPTNFSATDQLVGEASRRGLTVLPIILGAPGWDGQTYKGGFVVLPRADGPYAAFARALVRRYGPRGSFWSAYQYSLKLPIRMWQIWNEPNVRVFWPPQPYYSRYLALLRAAHDAIKAADPGAKVVLAGLPNYSWVELARMYRRGARKLFDVVALHPYTRSPQGVITILSYVRGVMNRFGDRRKPMIADEISWPSSLGRTTHGVGYDFQTTPAGQARRVAQVLPLLAKNRRRLGLASFYYYDWAGQDRPNYIVFDFSGLLHWDGASFSAKPALAAFTRAALAMEGCRGKGAQASICLK
jgi:hypothetical protein